MYLLHGDLHEEIYMKQPTGFIQTDSSLVCRLKKSLYGIKQAPRAWYAKMDSFVLELAFLGVILTILSTPRKWESLLSFLLFMFMILSLLVVILTL